MKVLPALLIAAAVLAASGTPLTAQAAKQQNVQTKRYKATGEVKVINRFTRQVTIQTKEIPGLEGKAMTVGFIAKDSVALSKLKEGDKIVGDLVVSGLDTYMENVKPATEADAKKG